MRSSEIKGVVFDMDGLLLDTERLYFEAFRQTLNDFGLPQNDPLFLSLVGMNTKNSRALLEQGLGDLIALSDFDAKWNDLCKQAIAGSLPVKPGVQELVQHITDQSLPFIIATSTNTDRARAHLAKAGLDHLFPDIIGGDRVSAGKPAPDIYLLACETLGVPPESCIAFAR